LPLKFYTSKAATSGKSATVQGFYWYQKLTALDWIYQDFQYGTKTNYMPTNVGADPSRFGREF
jgi:hypothetical protein